MTIIGCIDEYVKTQEYRMPIFANDIYNYVKTKIPGTRKDVFNEYVTRYAKRNPDFLRFQKGIYYRAIATPFGEAGINYTELVKRVYITNGNDVFGYETGPSLMNKMGLTTQMPTCTYIATDRKRVVIGDFAEKIYLIKPVIAVTENNYRYLQLLDLLDNRLRVNVELDETYYKNILRYFIKMNRLSFERLLYFGRYYRNEKIYRRIAELAQEEA